VYVVFVTECTINKFSDGEVCDYCELIIFIKINKIISISNEIMELNGSCKEKVSVL